MADTRTRVLFVGGYGRSGSTILDILLDRVPGITAVGEFRHLFGRALADNELCSCGQPFQNCPFWQKVLNRAFPSGYDRSAIQQAVKTFNTIRRTGVLQHPGRMNASLQRQAELYRQAFTAAYQAVAEVSGAKVIIDSSKYPMHGLFLQSQAAANIDLQTMLLVRDPRAVAYSWQRRRLRPEVHWEKREMPRHSVVRSAIAWNVSNSLTEKIDPGKQAFRLQRYEDFIAKPLANLEAIAGFAFGKKVQLSEELFETQPSVPHTIAGNPVRIGSGHVTVRSDNQWQTDMNPLKKLAVTACCAPQMHRYGYLPQHTTGRPFSATFVPTPAGKPASNE